MSASVGRSAVASRKRRRGPGVVDLGVRARICAEALRKADLGHSEGGERVRG